MKRRLYSLVLLMALAAAPAFGQGCAMCYTSAKGASTGGQKALTHAVIALLVPPVGMMVGLVGFALRYRRDGQQEDAPVPAAIAVAGDEESSPS